MRALGDADTRQVGRYRLLVELGQGGMGRVFLGYGPDGRLVAVKQVRAQLTEEDGFLARFRQEVAVSRTVSGAYTAAVVDADVDGLAPWLASVFVPGPSLQDTVDTTGVLPAQPAMRLAAGLASALIEIHRAGLVHRDLKPSNVLLTADGLRVIDFGIARALDGESTRVTRSGWLIGSPEYMSPEQAEGHELTAASDVFSLGSVLVMACTGSSPFAGPSAPRTLYNLVHADPDLTALPARVRELAELCLAKDPADRPSPEELLTEIDAITPSTKPWPPAVHELIERQHAEVAALLDGTPADTVTVAPPHVETTTMPMPGSTPRADTETQVAPPVPRRRWLVPVLAVAAVAVAVAGFVMWSPWRTDDDQRDGLAALTDGTDLTTVLALSPDGDTLAALSYSGAVQLWHVADGSRDGAKITASAVSMDFSPDGELLATGGNSDADTGVVQWWDVDTQRQVGAIELPDTTPWVLFSPDGRLVTESNGIVQWWDVGTRQQTGRLLPTSPYRVLWFAPNPAGDRLVTSGDDGTVRLWDSATGRQVGTSVRPSCADGPTAVAFSPDGATFAVGDACGTTTRWSVSSGKQAGPPLTIGDGTPQDYNNDIAEIAFSPDGETLAAMIEDDAVGLWRLASGKSITSPPIDRAKAIAFTDDQTLAVAEYNDRVWSYRLPG